MIARWKMIPLEAEVEWRNALEGIPHGFGHTWECNCAMSLTGNLRVSLYSFESGDIRVVCPLGERQFKGYTDIVKPYGFNGFVGNGPCEEFPAEWRRFANERGYVCGYLGIHPFLTDGTYYRHEEACTYNNVLVLDLTLSEEELVRRMSRNRRQQIRQFQRERSAILDDRESLREFFVGNYAAFMTSRGAGSSYSFSGETLSYLASLDNVFLIGKSGPGGIEAAAVFAFTPNGGDCLFIVSIDGGRVHSSELVWQGMRRLKALGVPLLNLGGGHAPSDGRVTFKSRFGPESFALKCLKQVYDGDRYCELCRQAGVAPDTAGFFPAYRNGDLP
jgi:hypothetical protein